MSGAENLRLDSILWEDYSCSGPNQTHACEEEMARLTAERDLLTEISTAGNVDDDAVIQKLRDAGGDKARYGVSAQDNNRTYENFYRFYKQRGAISYYNSLGSVQVAQIVDEARKLLKARSYPK